AAQQLRVADGPDVRRAQQADAREGFFLRKGHGFEPTLGSSPLSKRAMFDRCWTMTTTAMATSAATAPLKPSSHAEIGAMMMELIEATDDIRADAIATAQTPAQ